ncbi:bifunctional UDP-N-acetylglucosamine diphosphorylase/glucosamine-1-phosphate N-acetyltransferase GlmU [Rhodoblastus acidophilus]|uniref:Bifunctional protein GlmU n=1 Tax=Rhodoblastus acidophilus TaxID=1074 RepID=A0A6N8DQA4_RHOAC|nr:bifunctional UDP-N-acetylglucosamine diphosphorylase/glucosamine-1-phosphate N-acetyltransferase GlmU [Rhodoblastus acidophilus]MCW2276013.1 bifunctional UDP-N-acetylglucosamine pyrophosphorylase/glucosamine-1-phosphate N-acetyltransferase [Rhodoblastus acidophilus]MTV32750.1 bifunctional UDP-N-acetylglucosamine diphosphorylase/glucosamine-1-phosphate N-acetyltransferase GlmU [Rhodoblastus acidophilus]
MRKCLAIVLAAGEGKRMRSSRPKVLHQVAGRSMLAHVLDAVAQAGADELAVVVGPGRDDVAAEALRASSHAKVFVQSERLGTAHAVLAAREAFSKGFDDVLVLFADTPLVRPETFRHLRAKLAEGAGVAVLGFEPENPFGYGRLLTDDSGALLAIREHKDARPDELQVKSCNAGLMALDGAKTLDWLSRVGNANAQKEYYLPDVVEIARADGASCALVIAPAGEVLGVNDRVQLAQAEAELQNRLRRAAMENGATLIAPETVFFSYDTVLGADVLVEPHVVFGPGVTVADHVVIHAFSHLEGATLAEKATIGPYARLRPGANLARGAKVGNFVEIKKAEIGEDAKVNHLTYIGDATIGPRANIGAGVITCNYDGFLKYRTEIGADAFVGSNCSLVAPVKIGDGALVGSGSVVTKDVAADALAVARGKQMEKPGWAAAFRDKMRALKRASAK